MACNIVRIGVLLDPRLARVLLVVAVLAVPLAAISPISPAAAASGSCYLIGRVVDHELSITDLSDTNPATNETTIGPTGGTDLGPAVLQPSSGTLFTAGPAKLGTINTGTGEHTPYSDPFGMQPGSAGVQALNDVSGLAFDPTDGTLFGIARRVGEPDLLFQIDPADGASVADAFGPGAGYVEIVSDDISYQDFYGIAISDSGQLVGIGNDGVSSQWKQHTIDKVTGAATAGATLPALTDLSYDAAGNLWALAPDGTLADLGSTEPTRTVDNLVPYSGLGCIPAAISNNPPVFDNDLLDRADAEGTVISLAAGATDPDLDTLLYAASGLPPGLSIDPGSGLISGTIGFGAAAGSPYATQITVTDDGVPNLNAVDTFTWTVSDTNRNPIFDADLLDRTDAEGAVISLAAGATDPDLDTLLYSATGLPAGLAIDPVSGLISGTIAEDAEDDSPYAVTITVTDDGIPNLNAVDTFTWTVTDTNRNPIFDNDLLDRSDAEGTVVSLAAGATDPDLDTLLYSATGLPPGLSIDPGSGLISGTIDFTAAAGSPYATQITVTDDGTPNLNAVDTFTWTVTNTNREPVGNGEAYVTDVDSVLTIPAPGVLGNDYDPDGDLLTLTLDAAPDDGLLALLPDGSFTYVPDPGFVGTATFTYQITDPWGDSVKVDVTITVDTNAAEIGLYLSSTVIDADTFELTPIAPISSVLPDHEPDGSPGLTIAEGTGDDNEADPAKFQLWEITLGAELQLRGPASVETYSAVAAFALGEHAHIEAWLLDCDATGTSCLEIAQQDIHRNPWDSGTPTFDLHRIELGHVDHAFSAGRMMRVMLQSDANDMWLAFDTVDYPARLLLTGANQPPVISDPVHQVVAEGSPFLLTVTAGDPDGHPISWFESGMPGWGTVIDNGDGSVTLSGTPGYGDAGSAIVTLTASDGTAVDMASFNLTVSDVNRAPVFDADLLDQLDGEGAVVSLAAGATDPDSDTLLYSATGLPPGLSIDPGSGLIAGTIGFTAAVGSPYATQITVTDDGVPNLNAVDSFTWTVTDTNRNPVFDSDLLDRADAEGATLALAAGATDPDLDTLTYTATGLPPGLSIAPASGLIAGTIDYTAAAGSPYAVEITVTDDGVPNLNAVDSFTWTVTNTNRNPIFDADLLDRFDAEGGVVSLAAGASDPDVDTLTYSATGLPPGLSIDPTFGLITGTIDYSAAALSPYAVQITVTDDGVPNLNAVDTFTWTVVNVNRPPIFDNDLPDRADAEGAVVALSAAATDPDPDILTYSATGLPPGLSLNSSSGLISGTISAGAASGSPYAARIVVTDDGSPNLSTIDTFSWQVVKDNKAPVLGVLGDVAGDEGSVISFAATASDPDFDGLTFSLVGAPAGAAIDPVSGIFSWTPGEAQGPGTYSVTVIVTDDGIPSLTDSQVVTVAVAEVNRPPSLAPIADQTSREGDVASLAVVASDPDLPASTLTYAAVGLPPGLTIDTATGLITGTIGPNAAEASPYNVTVVVSDEGPRVLGDGKTFVWVVSAFNQAPVLGVLGDVAGDEGSVISFVATALDPDLDSLAFSLVDAPAGALIDPVSGKFSWTPGEADGPALHMVTVMVADDGSPPLTATQVVNVSVAEVNRPPTLDRIGDQTSREGDVVSLDLVASDPDLPANTLTFAAVGLPPGLKIDTAKGRITGTIEPNAVEGSPYSVEISVSDAGIPVLSVSEEIKWTTSIVDEPAERRKKLIVDSLQGSQSPTVSEPTSQPIRRSIVLMASAAGAAAAGLRWPFLLLLLLLGGFAVFGRIGLYPLFKRGERESGMLGFFDAEVGFGLIAPDTGHQEIFVHVQAFPRRQRSTLKTGTRVQYRVVADEYRPRAWGATTLASGEHHGESG